MDDNVKNLIPFEKHVFVCNGKSCSANGSAAVKEAFVRELTERGLLRKAKLDGRFMCTDCSSVGFCEIGPAVLVYPEGLWYAGVQPQHVTEIIDSHLLEDKPLWHMIRNRVPSEAGSTVRVENES